MNSIKAVQMEKRAENSENADGETVVKVVITVTMTIKRGSWLEDIVRDNPTDSELSLSLVASELA